MEGYESCNESFTRLHHTACSVVLDASPQLKKLTLLGSLDVLRIEWLAKGPPT